MKFLNVSKLNMPSCICV